MKTSKLNIGLALSKNYDKVTLVFEDELVEYESDAELKAKIRKIFNVVREEVNLEFEKLNEKEGQCQKSK